MFLAYSKKDDRLIFSGEKPEVISAYMKAKDLFAPFDKSLSVTWRKKAINGKREHFALMPNQNLTEEQKRAIAIRKKKKSGLYHENAQYAKIKQLLEKYSEEYQSGAFNIDSEVIMGDQIADIYFNLNGHREVVEIQLSPITLESLIARTEGYVKKGVDTVHWVCRDKIIDKDMKTYLIENQGVFSILKIEGAIKTSSYTLADNE